MCIWLPRWPLQRLQNALPPREGRELVLFSDQNQRPTITVCSTRAERQGLHVGQPLAEAKALFPSAVYLAGDPVADRAALCQLALDCQKFSPLVGLDESDPSDTLLCEVSGCTHLWGGEQPFLHAVRSDLFERCLQAQIALAGTPGAAWALAHTKALAIVPAGKEDEALSALSIAALRLPPATLEPLVTLGLLTIGDLLRLPRETLASRFGEILPRRLDQAMGRLSETFVCERLKEPLAAIREWEAPVDDRFAIALVCRQLLRELLRQAGRIGMWLSELEGELRTETEPVRIAIRLVEATQDEGHLAQLIELELERARLSGGVVAIRWTAVRLGRLEQAQGRWFGDETEQKSSRAFNSLVDRLKSRLESSKVLKVELVADSQPEKAFRLVPWSNQNPPEKDRFVLPPEQSRGRPCRLLRNPLPIAVSSVVPDGPPIRMVWQKEDCHVVRTWGPERIATGWWRAQDIDRDYYRAEWEDGTQVWIYRDQRLSRWFLHGFFD
jgi:protein ImuB